MALGVTARHFIKQRPTFKNALTPEQSKIMGSFLRTLLWAGEKAIDAGVKPNIGAFIDCWAGRTKNQEEWKAEAVWRDRERRAKRNGNRQRQSNGNVV